MKISPTTDWILAAGEVEAAHDITVGAVGANVNQTPDALTTQQAADLLHVSLPYLVKLLDQGEIVSWVTDGVRRISREDLLAYKQDLDAKRLSALAELTALSQELGLYDDPKS